jgi:hypothetical protein
MSTPDHLNQISKIISQKLINPKMNELTISQSASNRKHNNIKDLRVQINHALSTNRYTRDGKK